MVSHTISGDFHDGAARPRASPGGAGRGDGYLGLTYVGSCQDDVVVSA
jgi:hypothetical protein